MRIIPAIDLKNGRCVRLSEGKASELKVYDSDPIAMAHSFKEAGAEFLHIVDLDGAFAGHKSSNRSIVNEIVKSVAMKVEFGGGVRAIQDVEQLIELGVAQVILGTVAVEEPETLAKMIERFGQRVCVGIDARDGKVMTRGWEKLTDAKATEFARFVAQLGVRRVIYTDISRDGMLTGVNVEQTCEVARSAQIPITASGGISSLEDILALKTIGEPLIDSVIVGKALYEGRFKLEEALQIAA